MFRLFEYGGWCSSGFGFFFFWFWFCARFIVGGVSRANLDLPQAETKELPVFYVRTMREVTRAQTKRNTMENIFARLC